MGNYRSQYERYYKNLLDQKKGISLNKNSDIYSKINYGNVNGKSKNKVKFIDRLLYQCIFSMTLLVIMFSLKNIPMKVSKDVYNISKKYVTQDFSKNITYSYAIDIINKMKATDLKDKALNCMNLIKEKTNSIKETNIKSEIKDKYCLPVLASYMKLQGDNNGVLIEGKEGTQVISCMDGTVAKITNNDDGQSILINHGNGIQTYYGMLKNLSLKEGDELKKGEYLGDCSKISNTEKTGVIFKFIYMGKEQDPTEYLDFSNLDNV